MTDNEFILALRNELQPIKEELRATQNDLHEFRAYVMMNLLKPIHRKLGRMENEMDDIEYEIKKGQIDMEGYANNMASINRHITNIETDISDLSLEIKQGFRKNNDKIESLITILKAIPTSGKVTN